MTNRDAGVRVHVCRHTIVSHLPPIYRRLGIH
jgi:hypothetical protein